MAHCREHLLAFYRLNRRIGRISKRRWKITIIKSTMFYYNTKWNKYLFILLNSISTNRKYVSHLNTFTNIFAIYVQKNFMVNSTYLSLLSTKPKHNGTTRHYLRLKSVTVCFLRLLDEDTKEGVSLSLFGLCYGVSVLFCYFILVSQPFSFYADDVQRLKVVFTTTIHKNYWYIVKPVLWFKLAIFRGFLTCRPNQRSRGMHHTGFMIKRTIWKYIVIFRIMSSLFVIQPLLLFTWLDYVNDYLGL